TSPRTVHPPPELLVEMDREIAGREANEEIDNLIGLDNVKRQLRGVQTWEPALPSWVAVAVLTNPRIGKTTVARIYAKLLFSMDITDSRHIRETTGAELASTGIASLFQTGEESRSLSQPSTVIIDHPYDMRSNQPVVEDLMQLMELPTTNRLIVIFTGDSDEMDKWLREQPRLRRLTCSSIRFPDFDRDDLLHLLGRYISQEYHGRMQVEGGLEGQYMQVAARRLAHDRTKKGHSNIYSVREFVAGVARRQAEFLTDQQDRGMEDVDHFFFSKEDLLGLRPTEVIAKSEAWAMLQKMVGQGPIKTFVREVLDTAEENYWREIQGQKRLAIRLNRTFIGPPGTGKTTAARLYVQILADLALLRNPTGMYFRSRPLLSKPSLTITVVFQRLSDEDAIATMQSSPCHNLIIDVDAEVEEISPPMVEAVSQRLLIPQDQTCTILLGSTSAIDRLFSDPRGPKRAPPMVVQFEALSSEDMKELVELKLQEQDVSATPEALQAALEILEHARLRKDFDYARAIDHLLIAAHRNFTARQTAPANNYEERILEAQDFSIELSSVRSALSFREELRHTIVPDDIIAVLKRYHNEMRAAWLVGQNPIGRMPSAFVFKGACGTGKRTVARQLGALYYRMGVLSSEVVVECSVADLLATQGAREQFARSRGQVLYVEDAHHLADCEIAAKVVDELVYLIPRQEDQTVVILAGQTPEMDQLLANRPRLSAIFQEEIVFRTPTPRECLRLLDRRLEEKGVTGTRPYLSDPQCPSHREFTRAVQVLSMFPCWGNAKDIEVLARWMLSAAVRVTPLEGSALADLQLSEDQAMTCMIKLYNLKRDRLRYNQDPKARTLPRVLSQPRCATERAGVKFPV
ncbi:hypothetical protein ARAM_002344, partial [Aspergillus rambellii]